MGAVGDSKGTAKLRYIPGQRASTAVDWSGDSAGGGENDVAPIDRLDNILQAVAPAHLDICGLKVDVEGAEPRVLQGAIEFLKTVEVIVIEYMPSLLQKAG